jgi:hypothetical protein
VGTSVGVGERSPREEENEPPETEGTKRRDLSADYTDYADKEALDIKNVLLLFMCAEIYVICGCALENIVFSAFSTSRREIFLVSLRYDFTGSYFINAESLRAIPFSLSGLMLRLDGHQSATEFLLRILDLPNFLLAHLFGYEAIVSQHCLSCFLLDRFHHPKGFMIENRICIHHDVALLFLSVVLTGTNIQSSALKIHTIPGEGSVGLESTVNRCCKCLPIGIRNHHEDTKGTD